MFCDLTESFTGIVFCCYCYYTCGGRNNVMQLRDSKSFGSSSLRDSFEVKVQSWGQNGSLLDGRKLRTRGNFSTLVRGAVLTLATDSVLTLDRIVFGDEEEAEQKNDVNEKCIAKEESAANQGREKISVLPAQYKVGATVAVEAIVRLVQVAGSTWNRRRCTLIFTLDPEEPIRRVLIGSATDPLKAPAPIHGNNVISKNNMHKTTENNKTIDTLPRLVTVRGDANIPPFLIELQLMEQTVTSAHNSANSDLPGTVAGLYARSATVDASGMCKVNNMLLDSKNWIQLTEGDKLHMSSETTWLVQDIEFSVQVISAITNKNNQKDASPNPSEVCY